MFDDIPLWADVRAVVQRELEDGPGCHDYAHTRRVLRNTVLIAEKEKPADLRAALFGALLHDIARPEELASGGKLCHAALGAGKAERILRAAGFTDEAFIRHVSEIVRTHRYRGNLKPATVEACIVYDADKLDSLGAFGVARAFHFAGRIGACLHNSEREALASESYSNQDSAYREYLVKLRSLPDHLLTDPARRIAADRAAFMRAFFERLNEEQEGVR